MARQLAHNSRAGRGPRSCLTPSVVCDAMGSQSRHRKAEKRRRRQRASSSLGELSVREVLYAAAGASGEPPGAGTGRYQELLARLALLPGLEAEVGHAL